MPADDSGTPGEPGDSTKRAADDPTSTPQWFGDDPVTPPQLENGPGWTAEPLLVSGTDGYADGEYRYQDYVYDDNGADTATDPRPHIPKPTNGANYPTGNLVYPTDTETYANNAADLLEFRTRPTDDGVAYRITLQTMREPDAAAVAIGIDTGGDGSQTDWGYGIGDLGDLGLDHVLVTWGTGAELDGEALPDEAVSVDTDRHQIELEVPIDPDGATWRHFCVVGLWNDGKGEFRQVADEPTATQPGGAHGTSPPPVFNVGFRFDEPLVASTRSARVGDPVSVEELEPGSGGGGHGHYREQAQAEALAQRDISAFHADVDFGALAAGERRDSVPETGLTSRLYASRFDLGEGISTEAREQTGSQSDTVDVLLNRLQPYSLYVPESYEPGTPHRLHLLLHGGGSAYTSVGQPNRLKQFGEDRDSLVLVPEARAPNLIYADEGLLDVVEALSDVCARFDVDPDRITVSGGSMGGYGTCKVASMFPDVFAKAFAYIGDAELDLLDNLRHVPLLLWNGLDDRLVPPAEYFPTAERLRELGYRHELNAFAGFGHLTFTSRDRWGPVIDFLDGEYLGAEPRTAAPRRVTYRRVRAHELPEFDVVPTGAYWVRDVSLAPSAEDGRVDVVDRAAEGAEPVPETYTDSGRYPGQHVTVGTRWRPPESRDAQRNALAVTLERVDGVTVDLDETAIDPETTLTVDVESSTAAIVTLESSLGSETVDVPAGTSEHEVDLA